jgi:integrase
MASAFITTRTRKSGTKRFVVRYRLGGFAYPIVHAGSFRTMREAKVRRDFVAAEIAAGRDPALVLRADTEVLQPVTLTAWFDRFIESKVDVGESARSLYGNARDRLGRLANLDPQTVRWQDVQAWIADLKDELAPKTVRHYLSTLRQVLDFCDLEPNPARSPKVKVPALEGEEIAPPAREEFDAIIDMLSVKIVLPVRLMEACGLRIGETTKLTYGDVDFVNGRLRISKARTKGRTAGQRWLPIPAELMGEIDELVPLEDRHKDRRVFPLTSPTIRDSITRACKLAGIAHYHPHDLRDLRISLWIAQGIDPVQAKTWSGHTKASMTLDVYAHVVIDPDVDEWREFWQDAYAARSQSPRKRVD